MTLRYTLVPDGPSDRVLLPILDWVIRASGFTGTIEPQWADPRSFWPRTMKGLAGKIFAALQLYPCDLLFIHRDAERRPRTERVAEIATALQILSRSQTVEPHVCVIPVRMTEAWLLFDPDAIRAAAGNASGTSPLPLPKLTRLEHRADPKAVLHRLLKQASGLKNRRLDSFPISESAARITQYIEDFSPLRSLNAFNSLESDLRTLVAAHGWPDTGV